MMSGFCLLWRKIGEAYHDEVLLDHVLALPLVIVILRQAQLALHSLDLFGIPSILELVSP